MDLMNILVTHQLHTQLLHPKKKSATNEYLKAFCRFDCMCVCTMGLCVFFFIVSISQRPNTVAKTRSLIIFTKSER